MSCILRWGAIEMFRLLLQYTVLYQVQRTMLNILLLNAINNDVWIGTKNNYEIDKRVKE